MSCDRSMKQTSHIHSIVTMISCLGLAETFFGLPRVEAGLREVLQMGRCYMKYCSQSATVRKHPKHENLGLHIRAHKNTPACPYTPLLIVLRSLSLCVV